MRDTLRNSLSSPAKYLKAEARTKAAQNIYKQKIISYVKNPHSGDQYDARKAVREARDEMFAAVRSEIIQAPLGSASLSVKQMPLRLFLVARSGIRLTAAALLGAGLLTSGLYWSNRRDSALLRNYVKTDLLIGAQADIDRAVASPETALQIKRKFQDLQIVNGISARYGASIGTTGSTPLSSSFLNEH